MSSRSLSPEIAPFFQNTDLTVYHGDCRDILPNLVARIKAIVTSPPYYGLRDYGIDGQLGLEETPEKYAAALAKVFDLMLPLAIEGACAWVVIGDTFANWSPIPMHSSERFGVHRSKKRRKTDPGYFEKETIGVPFLLATAIRGTGWALRSINIWDKTTPAVEPPTDRPPVCHEYILQFTKPFRGQRRLHASYTNSVPSSVWRTPRERNNEHAAPFPPALIRPMIVGSTNPGDLILDPFGGSGTTARVALGAGRRAITIDIAEDSCRQTVKRTQAIQLAMI